MGGQDTAAGRKGEVEGKERMVELVREGKKSEGEGGGAAETIYIASCIYVTMDT